MSIKISTRFAFTLLRPTAAKLSLLKKVPGLIFLIYGQEVAPNSGLLHLQGYFETSVSINIFKLKNILEGYYLEVARKTRESNIFYCVKDGKFKFYDPYRSLSKHLLDKLNSYSYNESMIVSLAEITVPR